MLPFLKAPADAPMTDKHEIDARYRYWRRHILLTIWLGYALFYFTRKVLTPPYQKSLANGVLSRSDIGLISDPVLHYLRCVEVCLRHCQRSLKCPLFYGDRAYCHGHYQHSVWLLDVAMGVCRALGVERLFGAGVHRCASVNRTVFSCTERGGWWALWNTAHNVGGALIPIVMAASALHYGWRAGMMIAGCMAIVVGIFLCWRLRDRPQALGLPAVGEWRHDALEIAQQQEGAGLTRKEILTKYVLLNPYIWLLSFCYVLVYGGSGGDQRLGQFVYVRDAGRRSGLAEYGSDNV